MKILLVEDNESIALELVLDLSQQRYMVDVAQDGLKGLELAEFFNYDLLLLNVTLPKISGIELCSKLRNCGKNMPIMLIADQNNSEQKVLGLDAGADDYLVKPFDQKELAARIRALLRRGSSISPPVLRWAALSLNPATYEVSYFGRPLRPTPKEYCLLELFLRHSRRVFSRSALLEHLWDFASPPEEDTVKVHIKGLRQKLKSVGAPVDLIETVYGIGYRLKQIS
jgi:DNA-binding response OmpR family regulator